MLQITVMENQGYFAELSLSHVWCVCSIQPCWTKCTFIICLLSTIVFKISV